MGFYGISWGQNGKLDVEGLMDFLVDDMKEKQFAGIYHTW